MMDSEKPSTKGVGRAFAEIAGNEGTKVVIGGRDEKAVKEALRWTYKLDEISVDDAVSA